MTYGLTAPGGEPDVMSYATLRRVVGVLGFSLPVLVALWGFLLCRCYQLQPSISDYYNLRTRDLLVGVLFTVAWFLFTYRAYARQDAVAGKLACLFALGIALFPDSGTHLEQAVHFSASLGFFLTLSYFALFLFTKTAGAPTPEKLIRNRIYRVCGVSMLLCLLLIGLYYNVWEGTPLGMRLAQLQPVFWLETLALWAFGISWFVKGETVFRDPA